MPSPPNLLAAHDRWQEIRRNINSAIMQICEHGRFCQDDCRERPDDTCGVNHMVLNAMVTSHHHRTSMATLPAMYIWACRCSNAVSYGSSRCNIFRFVLSVPLSYECSLSNRSYCRVIYSARHTVSIATTIAGLLVLPPSAWCHHYIPPPLPAPPPAPPPPPLPPPFPRQPPACHPHRDHSTHRYRIAMGHSQKKPFDG